MTSPAAPPGILLDDEHDRELVSNVHPPAWANPTPQGRYNLVVLGAGTAGLVAAVGAASLGAKVALVERHLLGGDCLNYGCVPSKGLLRAARAAHDVRAAGTFGVRTGGTIDVDFAAAMERMRTLRARISHHDSAERMASLGIDVYLGEGRFVGKDTLEVEGRRLAFARAVVATGARAASLPVPGLAEVGFLTNETVFSLTERPRRLLVLGAGPLGCELAQAFRRLGSEVTLLSHGPRILPREDADAAAILAAQFEGEGIRMILGASVRRVERREAKAVVCERGGVEEEIIGDEILLSVGRAANVEGLGLKAAGVRFDRSGVQVDDRLRTSNRRIYAAGDVCTEHKFTHAADAMARIALQNALFFGRKRASSLVIPWCTYTDPEVAHVGLHAAEAQERELDVDTLAVPLEQNDRAVLDGPLDGFARVHVERKSGRILGATLVAAHAGEMIGEVSLAMTAGLPLGTMGKTIRPYPTQAEVWNRLGDAWNRTRLTPRIRRVFERFLRWRR